MIKVILVDDHTMVREALRLSLSQDSRIRVVAEAGDGETLLEIVGQFKPDVVVMDVSLPGISGLDATKILLVKYPEIKVLGLSTFVDGNIIQQFLEVGAKGYIVKSAAGIELVQGILSVVEGRNYLCSASIEVFTRLRKDPSPAKSGSLSAILTARELQIVKLLVSGKSAPMIAEDLFLSANTINVHRRNIMKKVGVHKVTELTKFVIRDELI
jgi:two-component system NarL family response regulator